MMTGRTKGKGEKKKPANGSADGVIRGEHQFGVRIKQSITKKTVKRNSD